MNEDKLTKIRTERPDKAAFSAFLGVFLLVAGVCFGIWAFWTFQHYQRAAIYAEYLRENPNAIDSKYNRKELAVEIQRDADHDQLEAAWVGAISLILLIGAALLFLRAVKIYRRIKRNEYEEIDWRALEKPTRRVEVRSTRYQSRLGIGLLAFFALTTVFNLSNLFRSPFATTYDIIYKTVLYLGLILPLISVFIYTIIQARRKTVKSFDASGVTRGDGRHFLWSDFRGTIKRIGTFRYGGTFKWRTELMFADNETIWVMPQRIKNLGEVETFVNKLPNAVLRM